ncbi:MAG: 2-hydroxyacid dehydrogenase, partial [Clostridia bacterium]|nr:2-hydroxyacid dehydrogenase [Clostridia bacterium]
MKFAFFDAKPYDIPSFNKYGEAAGISFKYFDTRLTPDTVELCRGFDGVCVFVNDEVNAKVIDALCSFGIRVIALRCAGFNNVDIEYAHGKITLVRVPAYSPYAVAEHAMAMILTSIRRTHKAYIRTRNFNFSLTDLCGFDLHGKTVGVVGTGKIGRVFIDICRGFGMKIVAFDPYPAENSGIDYVSLPELFAKSDIVSLHCPLTDDTYHVVNSESIGLMKKGVVIVNTSRGALIDAEALLEGIKARKVGAACLDVYEEESDLFFEDNSSHILEDDTLARLISMPNV